MTTSLLAGHWVPSRASASWESLSSGVQAGGSGLLSGPPTGLACDASCARGSGSPWPLGSPGYVGCSNVNVAGPVDRHRLHAQVRPGGGVGRAPFEVQAEAGQALRGLIGQGHTVARQEGVRARVVDQVHVGVDAAVTAVARLRVQARPGRGQRVRAGGALTARGRGRDAAGERHRPEADGGQRDHPHGERDGSAESRHAGLLIAGARPQGHQADNSGLIVPPRCNFLKPETDRTVFDMEGRPLLR